jgi:hypothetical protein
LRERGDIPLMKDAQISVTGRRALAYTDIGKHAWPCVLFFHGAPSSPRPTASRGLDRLKDQSLLSGHGCVSVVVGSPAATAE